MPRCPGQDMRNWLPEDIQDARRPKCGAEIEIWKDEPFRLCRECGADVANPRLDLGCAEWRQFGDLCKGQTGGPEKERIPSENQHTPVPAETHTRRG